MKRFKKVLAGIMAATLVMSSATMFMAGENISEESGVEESSKGEGKVEATIDKKVFRVVLPTVPEESPFHFILDPEGVIESTSGSKYNDYTLAATGSMYFMQASPKALNTRSDALTVTNKSSVDVNITLTAKVTTVTNAGIEFATSDAYTGTGRGIFFNLNGSGTNNTATQAAVTVSSAGLGIATIQATMPSANAYYYEAYDATSGSYSYVLNEASGAGNFATYSFYVNGGCNTEADWVDYTDKAELEVIWKLEGVGMEVVQKAEPQFKTGSQAGLITWVNGTGVQVDEILSVTMTNSKKTWEGLNGYSDKWSDANVDKTNCKIQLDTAFASTEYFDETNNIATIKYKGSDNQEYTVYNVKVKLANN